MGLFGVTAQYFVAPGVRWHRLDDEVVVYLSERFETHLIDDAGGQLLQAVEQMQCAALRCSASSLYAWLSSDAMLDCLSPLESDAVLLPRLDQLVQVGVLISFAC